MAGTRFTAEQRRDQMVLAAVTAFARGGYAGTTTDQIAELASVSQPYVIRLFGTKRALFLAAAQHATSRIEQRFREAAAEQADLESLGYAFDDLLAERELITLLLHGFAAGADPELGPTVRECLGRIYRTVRGLTGAGPVETGDFLALGMLLVVLGAMRIIGPDAVPHEPWVTQLIGEAGTVRGLRG